MKQIILIIDDSSDILKIASELLGNKQISIITAENGSSGLKKAYELIPDLILLDIVMPGVNGFEVCSTLKNDERTKDIPVVLMSGLVNNKDIIKGLKIGAVDYIKKPFNIDELKLRVNIHLELIKPKKELIKQTKIRIQTEKELRKSETRFRNLFLSVPVGLYRTNKFGQITEANPAIVKILNYPNRQSLLNTNIKDIFVNSYKLKNIINLLSTNRTVNNYISELHLYNGDIISTLNSVKVVINNGDICYEGSIINITESENARKALNKSKEEIEKAHKDIIANINYAKSIQDALLTSKKLINSYLNDYFLLFKPKEKVSGDFYYINKINNNIILAVADCTGHGVTGGFLTVLGITYLHEIVRKKEKCYAANALNTLRKRFKNTFRTFGSENENGLDIAFCVINTQTNILQYAGANNPLWIFRNNELHEYKATRNPIGFYYNEKNFTCHKIQLKNNDLIYLFSDGFYDQLNDDDKKYTKKRFRQLLLKINHLPLQKQKIILEKEFETWKGNFNQIDDITIFGIKWNF